MGLRIRLQKTRVWLNVQRARLLKAIFGFEQVVLFVNRLNKESTQAILRHYGAHIGQNCDIESGLVIHRACGSFINLTLEDNCHLGKQVFLDLTDSILIRESSTVSMRSMILTHFDLGHAQTGHDGYKPYAAAVEIGPRAYLGAGVMILPGVQLGADCIIGAGAVVNRDMPARVLAVGVPATGKTLAEARRENGVS